MDRRDRIAAFGSGEWPRESVFDRASMTARVPAEDLDLAEDSEAGSDAVTVRCRAEVCGTCGGRGHHVNPAIDADGLSAEDFAEDPDFAEEYTGGTYDVPCYECRGSTTVLVADESANAPEVLAALAAWRRSEASYRRERAAELRYGC